MDNTGENEWMSLPESEQQLQKLCLDRKIHPALRVADNAMQMKRSHNRVFILLVGLTGGGKSSTVDYLFGTNVGETKMPSAERSTVEYTISLTSTKYRIPDLPLSIIDTPGFGHADGLVQDAKNILSIKHFLQINPYIRNRYPNLVMIILDIMDNRATGHNSDFAKMLRGICNINAIDVTNQNVVVVLTHAMSIARNAKIWEEKVEIKKEQIKAIVNIFLGVVPEIVVLENEPEINDLKFDGDCFLLPNNEKQPEIVYQACEKILNTAQDEIGKEAVAVCFRPSNDKKVKTGQISSSSEIQTVDTEAMQTILLHWTDIILTSEVGGMLEDYKNRKIAKKLVNDIFILQARLRKFDIFSVSDLNKLSMNQLVSKTSINREMQKVVEEVFYLSCDNSADKNNHVRRVNLQNQPIKSDNDGSTNSDNDGSTNSLSYLVAANRSPSSSGLCCFHEDSLIMLHNQKQKRMKDLSVGDKILTADSDGTLTQDQVIAWLHQVRDGQFTFLQIVHDKGRIMLSSEHIIFVGYRRHPKHASCLNTGDELFFFTDENDCQTVTMAIVLSIHTVKGRGLYAPLTYSGRLLVDKVDVSCYSSINPLQIMGKEIISSHALAHVGFLPLRMAFNVGINITTRYPQLDDETGVHFYARWLMKVTLGKFLTRIARKECKYTN